MTTNNQIDAKGVNVTVDELHKWINTYTMHEELRSGATATPSLVAGILLEYDDMLRKIATQDEALRVMRDALILYRDADIAFQHGDDINQAKLYMEACAANKIALEKANSLIGGE